MGSGICHHVGELVGHDAQFHDRVHAGITNLTAAHAIDHLGRAEVSGTGIVHGRGKDVTPRTISVWQIEQVVDGCPGIVVAVTVEECLVEVVGMLHAPMDVGSRPRAFFVGGRSFHFTIVPLRLAAAVRHEGEVRHVSPYQIAFLFCFFILYQGIEHNIDTCCGNLVVESLQVKCHRKAGDIDVSPLYHSISIIIQNLYPEGERIIVRGYDFRLIPFLIARGQPVDGEGAQDVAVEMRFSVGGIEGIAGDVGRHVRSIPVHIL